VGWSRCQGSRTDGECLNGQSSPQKACPGPMPCEPPRDVRRAHAEHLGPVGALPKPTRDIQSTPHHADDGRRHVAPCILPGGPTTRKPRMPRTPRMPRMPLSRLPLPSAGQFTSAVTRRDTPGHRPRRVDRRRTTPSNAGPNPNASSDISPTITTHSSQHTPSTVQNRVEALALLSPYQRALAA
jgi:hypothetical protein